MAISMPSRSTSTTMTKAAIAALPKDQRFVRPPFAPDWDAAA